MQRKIGAKRVIRPLYVRFLCALAAAAVILNLVCMAYFSYDSGKSDEADKAGIMNQTVSYTDRFMKEIENGANMLSISSRVQKLMTYRISKNYLDYAQCMDMLTEYSIAASRIYRIDLYVQNTGALVTSSEGVFYGLSEEDKSSYETYMASEENWFWDMDYAGKEPGLVSQTRNGSYVSLIKPVYSKYTGRKMGVLCLSVELAEFTNLIPETTPGTEDFCLSYRGKKIQGDGIDGERVHKIFRTSEYSGLVFEYDYMPGKAEMFLIPYALIMLVIVGLFSVVFLSTVRITEKQIFDPANTLIQGFQDLEQGNFAVRIKDEREDEFREIFDGFNHMAEMLERMIKELSDERTHRNEFKFRLLQMQIKPHFLYNLFNNMIWMMEQKDYEKLELLIQATAGYYKTALNRGNRDIMLVENRKQLEYYAEIQKIRLGDRFSFQVTIPDEVQFCSIPNLLLQPLVENSIVHGLDGIKRLCHIRVEAKPEGDQLVLTVEDDGRGIEPEELDSIRRETDNYEEDGSKYFALVNVVARIRSRYKERAAFMIDSIPGKGTRVVIKLPLDEVKECIG